MEKSKKEQMNDILTKLEDVKNSQEALIVKLATIQIVEWLSWDKSVLNQNVSFSTMLSVQFSSK